MNLKKSRDKIKKALKKRKDLEIGGRTSGEGSLGGNDGAGLTNLSIAGATPGPRDAAGADHQQRGFQNDQAQGQQKWREGR